MLVLLSVVWVPWISNLFQNCDVYFEDVNVNCDREHVLNGNRRSRYEQFHFIHGNCAVLC